MFKSFSIGVSGTLALILCATGTLGVTGSATAANVSVAVTAIDEHPALDAVRQGVQDELAAQGYEVGSNLDFQFESAQGNPATAAKIAQKFVGDAPDVIVPISTPSAQAVAAATNDIPIVFAAVTDPLGAKLVTSLEKPGGNITGMTNLSPIGAHLDLVKEITPDVARLGVIYNPGEANSVTQLDLLKQEAPARGLEIVEATAPRSSDVQAAAQSLVGKVDAIYVPTDNTAVTALEAIAGVGVDNQLPIYASDTDSVPRGAMAALGFDYYDMGIQTGKIVARVLRGEAPGDIPVENMQIPELHVNPGAAESMGVTIPEAVIARAKTVVE
jgi:putative ABC transport system substrate-binding protein